MFSIRSGQEKSEYARELNHTQSHNIESHFVCSAEFQTKAGELELSWMSHLKLIIPLRSPTRRFYYYISMIFCCCWIWCVCVCFFLSVCPLVSPSTSHRHQYYCYCSRHNHIRIKLRNVIMSTQKNS